MRTIKESKFAQHHKFELEEAYVMSVDTPYMMRNDGVIFDLKKDGLRDHPYIMRNPEEVSIQDITTLLSPQQLAAIKWFYEHTNSGYTQKNISMLTTYLYKYLNDLQERGEITTTYMKSRQDVISQYVNQTIFDSISNTDYIDDMLNELLIVNESVNQEFLRFRTGTNPHSSNKLSLYFRVSSVGFDWSDLIDKFIVDNYNRIADITISKDPWALGSMEAYAIKGQDITVMSAEEWISVGKDAIIESLFSIKRGGRINHYLQEGLSVSDIFWNCNPIHVAEYILSTHKVNN